MCAKIEDAIVLVKDILCTVAVMDIKIDNEYLLIAYILGITRHESDVIKDTKPLTGNDLSMMPRRTEI